MIARVQTLLRSRVPSAVSSRPAFILAVAVNIVLVIAYIWSRGGQTITLRLEARGEEVIAIVDGREFGRVETEALSGGPSVRLTQSREISLPALANPRGVRSVVVTDLDTGEQLYRWRAGDPLPQAERFQLEPTIDLRSEPWRDYALEVRLQNPTAAAIALRGGGVLFAFNRYATPLMFLTAGQGSDASTVGTERLEFDRSEGVRALVAMTLRPYPWLLPGFAALFVLTAALSRVGLPANLRGRRLPDYAWFYAAWFVALFTLIAAATIFTRYGQRMPHIVDETSHVYQAKLLASGRTHIDTPPIPEAFQFGSSPFVIDFDGRWASFYPFGHPVVLAIGEVVGASWLVGPLMAAVAALLVFLLGRHLYGAPAGLCASAFMAVSPFVLMQASSYMSHTTAAVYLLVALAAWWVPRRHPLPWSALSGFALGMLFNTRPLTALLLLPWFGLLLAADMIPAARRRSAALRAAGFVVGGAVTLALYFAYNLSVTGSWANGYNAGDHASPSLGFGGEHSVALGIENHQALLGTLIASLYGLPALIGLVPLLLPFVLGTRRLVDWWLVGASLTVMAGWILYDFSGIAYGPRYWFEIVPLLMLLTCRGAVLLGERLVDFVSRSISVTRDPAQIASALVLAAGVTSLIAVAAFSWLFAKRESWKYPGTPSEPAMLRIDFDNRLQREITRHDLHDALVLVRPCGDTRLCYQSVFLLNAPTLDGDVVYANDLGDRNVELFALYPCRSLYFANYEPPALEAAGRTPCDDP
jgi:4-amino-4-deoxy-L-arabinose transferase-like glycosyltransferase